MSIDLPGWCLVVMAISLTLNFLFMFYILPMKNRTLKFWGERYRYIKHVSEITQIMYEKLSKQIEDLSPSLTDVKNLLIQILLHEAAKKS